jgi:hypothetical protein
MSDLDAFAKLVGALSPWQGDLVFIGGWAHRLYRHHYLAEQPNHKSPAAVDPRRRRGVRRWRHEDRRPHKRAQDLL